MATRLKFVQSVWHDMLANGGVESVLLSQLKVVQAQRDYVRAELQVDSQHLNRLGSMHGGVVSTLVDIGGSLAVASRGMFMTGVTSDLATTFVRPVGKPGDLIRIECRLDRMGRSMAFTEVVISRLVGSEYTLVARGNHTKHIGAALKSPQNVEDKWDEPKL